MSGDLISRSLLLQKFQEDKEFLQRGSGRDAQYAYMSADSVIEKIKSMPTAYDVDKVVKQIEQLWENSEYDDLNTYEEKAAYGMAYCQAARIVKSGGIE